MSDFRRRLMMLRKSEGGLPSGYTKLNYLESTGTQYINLGFAIKYDNIVNVDVLITKFNIQQQYTNGAIFGSANESGLNAYNLLITKENKLYYRNSAGSIVITSQVIKANKKYDITTNLNNLIVNGVIYSGEFDFNYINKRPALLFARNSAIGITDFAYCRIYKFNILNQIGNVIINFVPCLDKNGKPCMYDTVSKKPFYNEGTGEFLYG